MDPNSFSVSPHLSCPHDRSEMEKMVDRGGGGGGEGPNIDCQAARKAEQKLQIVFALQTESLHKKKRELLQGVIPLGV